MVRTHFRGLISRTPRDQTNLKFGRTMTNLCKYRPAQTENMRHSISDALDTGFRTRFLLEGTHC